jgi:hypothetical protein
LALFPDIYATQRFSSGFDNVTKTKMKCMERIQRAFQCIPLFDVSHLLRPAGTSARVVFNWRESSEVSSDRQA